MLVESEINHTAIIWNGDVRQEKQLQKVMRRYVMKIGDVFLFR